MVTKRSPAPVVDRRVQRTRDALRAAMMQLMVQTGWDAIDVQTLCAHANVGRSTFYQHFTNKEELLSGSLADLENLLLQQTASQTSVSKTFAFLPGLLTHVYEAQDVFRAILGRRSGLYVQDRFRELLVRLVQQEPALGAKNDWQTKAKAHFIAGALFEMLVWWLGVKRLQKMSDVQALMEQWLGRLL